MIRQFLYKYISQFVFPNKGITHVKRSPQLIVSLTSYPKRISVVHKVINSLLRQSLKPDMLVLWLAEEEFPKREKELPKSLLQYTKHGLTIKWCANYRSYKKLIPSLLEFPEDIIVTADDDSIYSEQWLEALHDSYLHYPTNIHGHHAFKYSFDEQYNIIDSKIVTTAQTLSKSEMLIGVGGILYPPHSLYKDITISHLYATLAPNNDDFWFWAMARLQGTPIRLIENYCDNIVCLDEAQNESLWNTINSHGAGSQQFQNIIGAYPQLKEGLLS